MSENLFGARTSTIIMMTYVRQYVSEIPLPNDFPIILDLVKVCKK